MKFCTRRGEEEGRALDQAVVAGHAAVVRPRRPLSSALSLRSNRALTRVTHWYSTLVKAANVAALGEQEARCGSNVCAVQPQPGFGDAWFYLQAVG